VPDREPVDEEPELDQIQRLLENALALAAARLRRTGEAPWLMNTLEVLIVAVFERDVRGLEKLPSVVRAFWKARGGGPMLTKAPDAAHRMKESVASWTEPQVAIGGPVDGQVSYLTRREAASRLACEIRAAFPTWALPDDLAERIYGRMPNGTMRADRAGAERGARFEEDPQRTVVAAFKAAGMNDRDAENLFARHRAASHRAHKAKKDQRKACP
jgi:hypothetical protein